MKEVLKSVQVFRDVPLSGYQFVYTKHEVCMVRHLHNGLHIAIFYNSCRIFVNEKRIEAYNSRTKQTLVVPYNCEDRNEFFQLSTIYDYHGITYDDLKEFHEFCNFMVRRDLNERK